LDIAPAQHRGAHGCGVLLWQIPLRLFTSTSPCPIIAVGSWWLRLHEKGASGTPSGTRISAAVLYAERLLEALDVLVL
jgi:hypothetical protein